MDAAIIELSPEWLGTGGVGELFSLMSAAGLSAYQLLPDGSRGRALTPEYPGVVQQNVLFLRSKT